MDSTDRQALIRSFQRVTDGAQVITAAQFAKFLGISHRHAKKKLEGLPAFEGRYYLLTDVADMWIRGLKEGA